MQTGKATIVPVVLVEAGPKPYWRIWDRWVQATLVERRLVDANDSAFYQIVDSAEAAVRAVTRFYHRYHSARIVGDKLVFRLQRPLTDDQVRAVQTSFDDIMKGPIDQSPTPIPQEQDEHPELPRLILPFNRSSYGRLRQLIDFLNGLD